VYFVCLFVVLALVCVWFDFGDLLGRKTKKKTNKLKLFRKQINDFVFLLPLFRSNVIYYPLAQQSTLQQPIYLAPTTGATATTWPSNLFSQFNLANLSSTSNSNVSSALNPGTSSPQTVYELQTALFEPTAGIASSSSTIAGNGQTTGQQLYWSSYN
jgi:hypothetical protein